MLKNRYYISQYQHHHYLDGGVGNSDLEKIWASMGYLPLFLPSSGKISIMGRISRVFAIARLYLSLPKGAIIIFQWPVFATLNKWMILLLRRKTNNIICHISDIDGIKDQDTALYKKEISFFKHFRFFLVHNNQMKMQLETLMPAATFIPFQFFSFISQPFTTFRKKTPAIAFAGNLSKSGFLKQLTILFKNSELNFTLYGRGDCPTSTNVNYAGTFEPQQLPHVMEESFGLIWDGDSVYDLSGPLGIYQQLISPHKLSLYIVAGMPVIAHEKAGCAQLVHQYNIGITISSLQELDEAINRISSADYQHMRQNCFNLAGKIANGEFLKTAMASIEHHLA